MSILDTTEWKYNPAWSLDDDDGKMWNDTELSFRAKGVLGYMRSKPNGWQFSSERIAEDSDDGRRVVLSALNELIANGYISRKKLGSGRVIYQISFDPYVGIGPEIGESALEGYKVIIDECDRECFNVDNKRKSKPKEEEITKLDAIFDAMKDGYSEESAIKAAYDWDEQCDIGKGEKSFRSWLSWKKHCIRMGWLKLITAV